MARSICRWPSEGLDGGRGREVYRRRPGRDGTRTAGPLLDRDTGVARAQAHAAEDEVVQIDQVCREPNLPLQIREEDCDHCLAEAVAQERSSCVHPLRRIRLALLGRHAAVRVVPAEKMQAPVFLDGLERSLPGCSVHELHLPLVVRRRATVHVAGPGPLCVRAGVVDARRARPGRLGGQGRVSVGKPRSVG